MVLEGGRSKQNGIAVNNADEVTVSGFKARNYRANGFFFHEPQRLYDEPPDRRADRRLRPLRVQHDRRPDPRLRGVLRQRRRVLHRADAAAGQPGPDDGPQRRGLGQSDRVQRHQHALRDDHQEPLLQQRGRHRPERAGLGAVPAARAQRVVDNEIFWNNFNFHEGNPPFTRPRPTATGNLVPLGTGILLLGGRDHRIEDNKIFGNFLTGIAAIDGILPAENPQAASLDRNIVRNNRFGLGGTDLNGRDVTYDGSGSHNCFTLAPSDTTFLPDRSTVDTCVGPNGLDNDARTQMIGWTGQGALSGWSKHPHPAKRGSRPLEVFNP